VKSIKRFWERLARRAALVVACAFVALYFVADAPDPTSLYNRVAARTSAIQFSYLGWMSGAILHKVGEAFGGAQDYLDERVRSAYVVDYLTWVGKQQSYDSQITARLAKGDTDALIAPLRTERDAARAEVMRREPLAEAIAEGQVAAVLKGEGFDTLGQIIPPVAAHITQLPALLIISPRGQIRVESSVNVTTLSADQATALEDAIDKDLKRSSIIVPLGGLSLFPSMVIQTWYTPSFFEVIAHEWSHHYLYFFPLGLTYDSAEARILNETTAVLFGREVARKAIERYYAAYPQIIAQLPPIPTAARTSAATVTPGTATATPARFDFGRVMNDTRVQVDSLLAAGKIEEAETYMRQQQAYFAANGYPIRKLNQAYFAFYGGYQGIGGSNASGADPTGAAIAALRVRTGSLRAWLEQMRGITSRTELLRAAGM